MGSIVYPYFNLGKKKIHGTKPVAGSVSAWLNVTSEHALGGIYNSDHRWDMRYKYEVMLGYNTATLKNICYKKKVTTGRMKGTYYPYEFPFAICDSEKSPYKGESALLDRHFLQVGIGEKEVTPPLFVDPKVFCVLNSNIKTGEYHCSDKDWYKGSKPPSNVELNTDVIESVETLTHSTSLYFPEFNWENEVEVVVLVVCDSLDDKAYEKRLMKTDSIPAQIQLLQEKGLLTPNSSDDFFNGPKYDTALQPLGNIVKSRVSGLEFEWSKEVAGDDFSQLEAHLSESSTLEMLSGIRPDKEDADDKSEEGSGSLAGFVQNAISDKVDDAMDSVADSWDSLIGNGISKPVYAARIILNYQSLLGSMRNGIKPFGVNPFGLLTSDSDVSKDMIWKLRFRVTSAGDSGIANILAEGEYDLPYPQGLGNKESHWYKRDEEDFLNAKKDR